MARIRSIHPGLFTDEAFVSVSHQARLLCIGIWTQADDQGVFEWKPVQLKMRVFPADTCEIPRLLDELLKSEPALIRRFEVDEKTYGAVRNFRIWQRPKSPQALYPLPAEIAEFVGEPREETPNLRFSTLKKMLHEAQSGLCYYCGTEVTYYSKKQNSLEIEHKNPLSRGGDDELPNLCAACRECNKTKRTMTAEEFVAEFSDEQRSDFAARRRCDKLPKWSVASAKEEIASAKGAKSEPPPQREDGGWRMEDGEAIPPKPPKGADRFAEFWKAYPHREGLFDPEDEAEMIFGAMLGEGFDASEIIGGAKVFADAVRSSGLDAKHVMQARNWLARKGWRSGATESAGRAATPRAAEKSSDRLEWEFAVGQFRRSGYWPQSKGPKPSEPGFRGPPDLLTDMERANLVPQVRVVA